MRYFPGGIGPLCLRKSLTKPPVFAAIEAITVPSSAMSEPPPRDWKLDPRDLMIDHILGRGTANLLRGRARSDGFAHMSCDRRYTSAPVRLHRIVHIHPDLLVSNARSSDKEFPFRIQVELVHPSHYEINALRATIEMLR